MQSNKDIFENCPVYAIQKIIGGKWSFLVLYHLSTGTLRFGELSRLMPMTTQSILTRELRNLENYHLINRKVYAEVPPKVEYSLTDIGKKFLPVLKELAQLGEDYKQCVKNIKSEKS
ncbi:winged helix-turn-helix transcriptional regulator [Clostridium formicaceticum]|uniref:HTH-type transcriptional regulator YybR n=1 Tax=Clostridium formicaceticum TaxID=1497 RepID=A0AAC9RJK7_9CLOT|nr:helix-turn-helix domain-containing protein [Clostridium formicaceticum]AOY77692.1 MarR family transcriptional regulator [Clostridium formicaceticum]ARE88279.1 putative HTH-type transcriptional regulator YybR [Clostridium formicaceticum]